MSKIRASCFIRGSKHLETTKALRLRRRGFILFSVFGTPDLKLVLVFDILLQTCQPSLKSSENGHLTLFKSAI